MPNNSKVGSYVGTGAAVNVPLGFAPTYVRVINETDGDVCWEWFNGMTAGHAIQSINVVDNGVTGAAGMSRITANGVSLFGGSATQAEGFTAGTALSETGKTFRFFARSEDL